MLKTLPFSTSYGLKTYDNYFFLFYFFINLKYVISNLFSLVREWAKMRWGIFDEFSPKSSTFLNADYIQENVRCSRSRESFMYAPAKSNYFCSKNSGQKRSALNIEHYNLPPTLQNEHCDRKSTWEEQGSKFYQNI